MVEEAKRLRSLRSCRWWKWWKRVERLKVIRFEGEREATEREGGREIMKNVFRVLKSQIYNVLGFFHKSFDFDLRVV